MTLTEALETLAKVLPVEVVELIRGYFFALYAGRKINLIYNECFPDWGKKGEVNDLFKSDELNNDFNNIEDQLWNRACCALNDWLYGAYCEEYVKDYDDEEYSHDNGRNSRPDCKVHLQAANDSMPLRKVGGLEKKVNT